MEHDETDYHAKCSKRIFGTPEAPVIDYSLNQMKELAEKVVQSHITIPGVQAKLSFNFEAKKGDNKFTLVGLWGNYILKPPTSQYPELPENEGLTMKLADIFKIKTVPNSLIRLQSGELAYITKRIDRDNGNKIHMEDLCQLSERLTEDKYKGSMEQVGKVIMQYSSNPLLDALSFFEITLFSFITGNGDMHLKNFSLIHSNSGLVQLSPAYDLLSTRLVIPEKTDPEELALTLNGRKRKFKQSDFIAFAKTLELNEKQIKNVFHKIEKAISPSLSLVDSSFLPEDKKEEYKALIQNRTSRLFS